MALQATLGLVKLQDLLSVVVTGARHSGEGDQDGDATQQSPLAVLEWKN